MGNREEQAAGSTGSRNVAAGSQPRAPAAAAHVASVSNVGDLPRHRAVHRLRHRRHQHTRRRKLQVSAVVQKYVRYLIFRFQTIIGQIK